MKLGKILYDKSLNLLAKKFYYICNTSGYWISCVNRRNDI